MPAELTLEGITPYQALILKLELVDNGLVMDRDFVWQYNPSCEIPDPVVPEFAAFSPSSVTFTFVDPAVATFYKLKWTR